MFGFGRKVNPLGVPEMYVRISINKVEAILGASRRSVEAFQFVNGIAKKNFGGIHCITDKGYIIPPPINGIDSPLPYEELSLDVYSSFCDLQYLNTIQSLIPWICRCVFLHKMVSIPMIYTDGRIVTAKMDHRGVKLIGI